MASAGAIGVLGVAALAIGGAGWLLFQGSGGSGGEEEDAALERGVASDGSERATLTGRDPSRVATAVETVDGEFTIPGKVLDEKGKPVAGVTVAVRRTGEAYPEGDPKRWSWAGEAHLKRSFEELGVVTPEAKPTATATSAEDGSFQLVVRRRGDYHVRAEPAAPAAGTGAQWYLNDTPPKTPLTLRVLPGSALKGRVVDAQDRGVDAVVGASWFEDGLGAWAPPKVATGVGGAFEFPAVPNGKVSLSVAIRGRFTLSGRAVTTPSAEEVVIRIGDSTTLLRGRVKSLEGEPVAGARVQVALQAVAVAPAATEAVFLTYFAASDADGQYVMNGPLGGVVSTVQAHAPGYLYTTQAPPLAPWSGLELAPGREAALDLVLWKGGTVEGRVSEKGTDAPLAGVEVQVHASVLDARITRPPMLTATTDAQGRYRIDGVPIGKSIVLPRHPTHYVPAIEALPNLAGENMVFYGDGMQGPTGPPPSLVVFVEREGQRVEKNLELAKGLPCSGRVVDAAGAPVAGAEVIAQGMGLGQYQWQWGLQSGLDNKPLATSDAEGKFTVPGLPPRKSWVLVAKKKPLIGEPSPSFELAAGAPPPEIVLKVVTGATLVGRVVEESGRGVANVQVMAWSQASGNFQQTPSVTTGHDGAFRIEGVPGGNATLNAWGSGRNGTHQMLENLTPGEVREGLEIKMTSGVELSGIATDENGAPARFKSLMAASIQHGHQTQTQTGADGSFKFTDVQAGAVRISAGNWENSVELAQAAAPATGVRVTWKEPPAQVIEGTVLDAQGKPVPLCNVSIRPKSSGNPTPGMMAPMPVGMGGGASGQVVNGWFRRNAVGKAPFVVEVSGPQDTSGRAMNLRAKTVNDVDPKTCPITITLEPGIQVAGQVVDPAGKGVENVNVGVGSVRSTTDAGGGFTLGGLAEGEVQLVVGPPAPWVRPQPVRVTSGATDVVVRLRAGLPIAGIVRGEGGKGLGNGWVNVSWKATSQSPEGNLGGQVKPDGRFRIEGIPEEASATVNVQMWTMEGQQQFAPKTFTAVRPGTDDLVVDLTGGASVEGIVVDANGKAFAQAWVMIASGPEGNQTSNWAPIQPDGTFKAAGLPPGSVTLTLQRHDGGPVPEAVRVDVPATGVKLVLPRSNPIKGTLVGAGSTAWRLWAWTTGENKRTTRVTYGADGKFSVEGASPGSQWMIAARTRNNDDDRYALGGPYAAGTENINLELRTGRSIEGTVVSADGADLPAGTWVRAGSDTWSMQAQTDAKGVFRLRGLPPGRYKLTAGTPNNETASQDDVDDGASGIRLTLRPQ